MESAEQPLFSAPAPSPHPSSELLHSEDLEVTPEKPRAARRRRGMRTGPGGRGGELSPTDSSAPPQLQPEEESPALPPSLPVTSLSVPTLNSTARLYHHLQTLKHQRHQRPATAASASTDRREGSSPSPSPSPPPLASCSPVLGVRVIHSASSAGCLEGALLPQSMKEVNVPRHASRYSELVPVDISEESFQRLTVKPRRDAGGRGGRRRRGRGEREGPREIDEPSIMEFFCAELEWEEAEWGVGREGETDSLEPVHAPDDAPFMLYRCMYAQK